MQSQLVTVKYSGLSLKGVWTDTRLKVASRYHNNLRYLRHLMVASLLSLSSFVSRCIKLVRQVNFDASAYLAPAIVGLLIVVKSLAGFCNGPALNFFVRI